MFVKFEDPTFVDKMIYVILRMEENIEVASSMYLFEDCFVFYFSFFRHLIEICSAFHKVTLETRFQIFVSGNKS